MPAQSGDQVGVKAMKRLPRNRRLPESPPVEPWKKPGQRSQPNRRGRTSVSDIQLKTQGACGPGVESRPQGQSSRLGIRWGRGEQIDGSENPPAGSREGS